MWDTLLGLMAGIGLSAASGFRVFVPLLVMGIAANNGQLTLAPGFEWIGNPMAIFIFGAATVFEVLGYFIPWFDNLLDTVATPAAVVAGTIITGSFLTGLDPSLQWTLALIAGGGSAGVVQGLTTMTRATSTATTGGLGNPAVSTAEVIGASVLAGIAVFWPYIAVALVALLFFVFIRKWMNKRRAAAAPKDGA